uniref:Uncharacterized protein n=1 Tax=Romanomermis culicivorax TaxID=13658 RepID=A0A915IEP4_ROMCU
MLETQKEFLNHGNSENLLVDQRPSIDVSKIEFENSFPDDALDKETANPCGTKTAFENLESRANFVVDKDFDDSFMFNLDDVVENYEKPGNVHGRVTKLAFPVLFTLNHDVDF